MSRTLKALSALLTYPTAELHDAASEIGAALAGDTHLPARLRADLQKLVDELAGGRLQFCRRIAQQRRQGFECPAHYSTSIGVLARFGVPNRLVGVSPPEQPLPKVKPQEPRRS